MIINHSMKDDDAGIFIIIISFNHMLSLHAEFPGYIHVNTCYTH